MINVASFQACNETIRRQALKNRRFALDTLASVAYNGTAFR
jgi:hypothetical protein